MNQVILFRLGRRLGWDNDLPALSFRIHLPARCASIFVVVIAVDVTKTRMDEAI